ncbi:hypothetical protein NC652_005510 [Populus alba x Populus x berolinensis]|nr:hypothetical protein NC652_005510 [Populus alba x Populus x berolinensis]
MQQGWRRRRWRFAVAGGFPSLSPLFFPVFFSASSLLLLCLLSSLLTLFSLLFPLSPSSFLFSSPLFRVSSPLFIEPVSMFFSLWSQGTGHAAAGRERLSRRAYLSFGGAVGGRPMSSVGGLEGPTVGGLEGPTPLNIHFFSFFTAVC